MQEMAAFKVASKNAEDARARAIGMHKGGNLALKAKVVTQEEMCEEVTSHIELSPEDMKLAHSEYMAFYAQNFWNDPKKAIDQRQQASGRRPSGPKLRVCYNCDSRFHFIAECPYERKEDHNGRLVLKDKSRAPKKKPFVKKKRFNNKKQTKVVLLNKEEEYSTGDGESEEDDDSTSEVAAIATTSTSTSLLFDSPNENLVNKNAHCFMARASEYHIPLHPHLLP